MQLHQATKSIEYKIHGRDAYKHGHPATSIQSIQPEKKQSRTFLSQTRKPYSRTQPFALPSSLMQLRLHNTLQHKQTYHNTSTKMVKVIVGMMGSSVSNGSKSLSTPQQVSDFLSVLKRHNIRELDTARVYNGGKSEQLLGEVHAHNDFAVSTKAPAFSPGSLSHANIVENCNKSLAALGQKKVDIYYLHGPDRTTPFEVQCAAIGQLYKEGKFERFGVSNIGDEEVREVYEICKREGYVLPTVYQGMYNPLLRKATDTLIPLLRELGMVFYAFGPLVGGLLAKPIDEILKPLRGSRFDEMPVFGNMFLNDTIITEIGKLTELCKAQDISIMEATLRWFRHHSSLGYEDGFILGASTINQIEASLSATEKGPLPDDVVKEFEEMWDAVKEVAPGYS